MTKKSDAPAIRFKGFSDAWEQRKLSEITDKVTEKNAGLQYVETFTNSAEFGIISQRDFFDHDIAKLGSLDGYYIVKNEDFVYNPRISTSAPVGPINRNKLGRTGVMSPLYTVFRPHDIDKTYLEYFFKCGYWHSFMNFNGDSGARSDRFSIRDNVFFQMPIPIPDIDEQRKIGELLTCLDNLITLHQRKFEKLTNVKKSMLEKMFPQNGSSYPEIRFKGFTDPWEQRKLIDLLDRPITDGPHETPNIVDDGIPFISADAIVDNKIDFTRKRGNITEEYDLQCCKKYKPEFHDVYLVKSGSTVGKVAIVETTQRFNIWSPLAAMRCKENSDPYFLFALLQTKENQAQVKDKASNGTQPNLSMRALEQFDIVSPYSRNEQIKIGEFFNNLDRFITLHQRELEKLQNIKKSMLEKMFV